MAKCRHRLPFFLDNYYSHTPPPIQEDEEEQLNAPQLHDLQPVQPNPDPPDPLPEVQIHSQPSVSGPMTRSKTKKQQSESNN